MITLEDDALLAALEGTHLLTTGERIESALRSAYWFDFFGGFVATAALAILVAGVTPLTWDHMTTLPAYVILASTVFIGAALLAARSGVTAYVIDGTSVVAVAGSIDRSWALPRTQVARARVSRGSFVWLLTLSQRDGSERRVVLPGSMRFALGLAGTVRATDDVPPNKGINQTRRGVDDGQRSP